MCLNLYTDDTPVSAVNIINEINIGGTTIHHLLYVDDTVWLKPSKSCREINSDWCLWTEVRRMNAKKLRLCTRVLGLLNAMATSQSKLTNLGLHNNIIRSYAKCYNEIVKIIEIARNVFNSYCRPMLKNDDNNINNQYIMVMFFHTGNLVIHLPLGLVPCRPTGCIRCRLSLPDDHGRPVASERVYIKEDIPFAGLAEYLLICDIWSALSSHINGRDNLFYFIFH